MASANGLAPCPSADHGSRFLRHTILGSGTWPAQHAVIKSNIQAHGCKRGHYFYTHLYNGKSILCGSDGCLGNILKAYSNTPDMVIGILHS